MANQYPDKTINYNIYAEGERLVGVGTVDMPEISFLTDTLKGAGIAGELETPVLGHTQSMSCTINWRTVTEDALKMLDTQGTTLTLRAAQQEVAGDTNALSAYGLKVVLKTLPKNVGLGTLEPGASTDTSTELEVSYLKIEVKGKEILEIDKLNFVYKVNGQDRMSAVRQAMGV
ncbi:MAG: phage major tail tube protein [Succinivibrio sp.]|nr:phage major tail tube protein [Succinivibrio sp.]